MRIAIHLVSVDLGGSWIRVESYNASGQLVRRRKAPGTTLKDLPFFLGNLFKRWAVYPTILLVGSKGVWTPGERRRARQSLKRLAKKIHVISDVEAAWLAAFGTASSQLPALSAQKSRKLTPRRWEPGAGVIVISGTGSIAFGKDRQGHQVRRGGLGPLLGDEGSAFWLGKEWLKHLDQGRASTPILKVLRTPAESVRRVAALAPKIIHNARQGHPGARKIIAEAQHQLALLVLDTAELLHLKNPVPVSWSGSVLQNPWFRRGFLKTLRAIGHRSRVSIKPITPQLDAVAALARTYFSPLEKGGSRGILS